MKKQVAVLVAVAAFGFGGIAIAEVKAPAAPAAPLVKGVSAPNLLPTSNTQQQATPTTQPVVPQPSIMGGNSAAPTRQPVVPGTVSSMMNSSGTRTVELPLPPPPNIEPDKAPAQPDNKGPYLPPELRDKTDLQSNQILPPLYGWKRILLKNIVMPRNDEVVTACGMKQDFIFDFLVRRLQDGGIPVMNKDQFDRMVPEQITVVATPTIITMQDMVISCTSWVQFQVTAEISMRIPPLMYRRTVPLLLWHDGMMVTSAKSTHNGALINAFIDLAMRFRGEWDREQGMVDKSKILD